MSDEDAPTIAADGLEPGRKPIKECAEWLAFCVRIGWSKDVLPQLQAIWWKFHDHRGNLV